MLPANEQVPPICCVCRVPMVPTFEPRTSEWLEWCPQTETHRDRTHGRVEHVEKEAAA